MRSWRAAIHRDQPDLPPAAPCVGSRAARARHALRIGLALAACVSALAVPAQPRHFHLAHQFASASLPDRTARRFAASVARLSAGQLRITVHADARFGDERDNVQLLRSGPLQFSVVGDLIVGELDPVFRVINMPFLYRDWQHAMAVYDGPIGARVRQRMAHIGLQALSWHYTGTRVLTANRPLRTPAELAGLVLRLPPDRAFAAVWRAFGAEVRYVPFQELDEALQLAQVEAEENPPNFIRAGGLYRHQRYLILTDHLPQRQFILASLAAMRRLTPAQRAIVESAAREASAWATRTAQEENQHDLAWLTSAGGMQQVDFDRRGVLQRLQDIPRQLAGEPGVALFRQIQDLH